MEESPRSRDSDLPLFQSKDAPFWHQWSWKTAADHPVEPGPSEAPQTTPPTTKYRSLLSFQPKVQLVWMAQCLWRWLIGLNFRRALRGFVFFRSPQRVWRNLRRNRVELLFPAQCNRSPQFRFVWDDLCRLRATTERSATATKLQFYEWIRVRPRWHRRKKWMWEWWERGLQLHSAKPGKRELPIG